MHDSILHGEKWIIIYLSNRFEPLISSFTQHYVRKILQTFLWEFSELIFVDGFCCCFLSFFLVLARGFGIIPLILSLAELQSWLFTFFQYIRDEKLEGVGILLILFFYYFCYYLFRRSIFKKICSLINIAVYMCVCLLSIFDFYHTVKKQSTRSLILLNIAQFLFSFFLLFIISS